jgi:hypothetical protein
MDPETRNARTLLVWKVPVAAFLIIPLSIWFLHAELFPTITKILADAPVVRVYPGSFATPLITVAMIVTVIMVFLKAVPASAAIFKKAVLFTTVLWVTSVATLFFSFVLARPIQQYYFPKNGYSECDQLHGNPTIWFTDWVKNPAWCVKGKDREWVLEQARIAQGSKASTASPEK